MVYPVKSTLSGADRRCAHPYSQQREWSANLLISHLARLLTPSSGERRPICLRYTPGAMNKKSYWLCLLSGLLLTACMTVSPGTAPTEAPPYFVTSTLPPTRPGVVLPTAIPPTLTATPNPLTPSPTSTSKASCADSAILV